MSVNLQKGQKIDLTKGGSGLKHIMVGLGWDEAQQNKSGFLGSNSTPAKSSTFFTHSAFVGSCIQLITQRCL